MNHTGEITVVNGISLIECTSCQFVHQVEHTITNYSQEYMDNSKQLNFLKTLKEDKKWWNEVVYPDIFETIESYLNVEQRRLLDVGAGWLHHSQYAAKNGWNVVALDPALQSYNKAQDLKIPFYRGNFDKNALHLGIFDAIMLYEVVEHLSNPYDLLKQAHLQLEENGLLFVSVPNDFNPLQQFDADNFWWVYPEHINYFTPESISKLLNKAGFDVLDIYSSFPMELFLLMGIDYTDNGKKGRKAHKMRKNLELNMKKMGLDHKDLQRFFYKLGWGRDLFIYARKSNEDSL